MQHITMFHHWFDINKTNERIIFADLYVTTVPLTGPVTNYGNLCRLFICPANIFGVVLKVQLTSCFDGLRKETKVFNQNFGVGKMLRPLRLHTYRAQKLIISLSNIFVSVFSYIVGGNRCFIAAIRVTRLSEFPPNGRLFALGIF
jgi:hypothetical protein